MTNKNYNLDILTTDIKYSIKIDINIKIEEREEKIILVDIKDRML